MKLVWRAIGQIFLVVTLAALPFSMVKAHDREEEIQTMLSITPVTHTVTIGEIINVEIRVDDIMELYGADIQLAFDPSAFQVLDADPSTPGTQITLRDDFLRPGFVQYKEADNSAGTIWYAVSQVNPTEPASGSGVLFEFDFKAKVAPGDYPLTFTTHLLIDRNADPSDPIDHLIQEAMYTIDGQLLYNYLPLIKH